MRQHLAHAFLHELGGDAPSWLTWAKMGLLAALAVTTLSWKALNEEMTYRASMLAGLERVVAPRQALWNEALCARCATSS